MSLFGKSKPKAKPMDMQAIMKMAGEIEDIAEGGMVLAADIDERAEDLGVPRQKLYAGLGMTPSLALKTEHEVQFIVCTGGCQEKGALPALAKLLDLREDRIDDGQPAFDVIPRACLSRCQEGAVVEVRTKDGQGLLPKATPESVEDAVAQILE